MAPSEKKIFVGLGEILWDLLPAGKQLGGAPANFAYHCAQLGNEGIVASRIGRDELGKEIQDRLYATGLSTDYLQRDSNKLTGTVEVELDHAGQPRYTIIEDVAWDHLAWNGGMAELAARTSAVCFGSLAQRSPDSRATILNFLSVCPKSSLRIFDINLRQHYFSAEILTRSLEHANIAKVNDEELPRVAESTRIAAADEVSMSRALLHRFNLDLVCVTRGASGSLLVTPNEISSHPGVRVKVADTIGSGDAFVAAVAHHRLKGSSLDETNEAANQLGGFVASQSGAMPKISEEILRRVA